MAVAQVASDRCADVLVNLPYLADLQKRMHVGAADGDAVGEEGRSAMAVLNKAADEAPTVRAWCDAVHRFFGPDGKLIPGLMRR